MAKFLDGHGDQWVVAFDAFVLSDAKKDTGIDLADIAAGGWAVVETNSSDCVRVLASICSDEIKLRKMTARDFAKRMRGEAITAGMEALREEAADFFPRSVWSAIRSNLQKRAQMAEQAQAGQMAMQTAELLPMLEAFSRLPPDIQDKLIASGGDTSSLTSDEASESVSGPVATPSSAATDLPGKSESLPAD
jgi:hypothetical protein